jgi:hypothetical protein
MRGSHISFIIFYALILWILVSSLVQSFQIDTTHYMVLMLRYAGHSYRDACELTYTSNYAMDSWHDKTAIAYLEAEDGCTNILRFFNRRLMYPLLSSLVFRLTGSVHSLAVVPALSYVFSGVLFYIILSHTILEKHSLYMSLIFLSLPIVVRKVGVLYLTDSLSLFMWLACTLLYYRHVKYDHGVRLLLALLLAYVVVRVNVFTLIAGFMVSSLVLRRHGDLKLFAATCLTLFILQLALMSVLGSYGLLDHYMHTVYTLGTDLFIYYERPEIAPEVLVRDYLTNLWKAAYGVVLRLGFHLNVFLPLGLLGYLTMKERVEKALFTGQIMGTLALFIAFPYPDTRFLVYLVPAFLYFSYHGFRRLYAMRGNSGKPVKTRESRVNAGES